VTVVEFGTRADANTVRDDQADHLTGRFDRRYSKVELVDDVPDDVEAEIRGIAADGRADRESGAGHVELTDGEKRRVGPFTGDNNYRKATAVKAAFLDAGIGDWEAHYDPELQADENTARIEQIRQQQTGADVSDGPTEQERLAKEANAAQRVDGEGCNHARDMCQHGDPDACEFLAEECGADETEVSSLLDSAEAVPYDHLDGEVKGALSRSWSGYKVSVKRLAGLLDEVQREFRNAERAAATIDAIEEGISDINTEQFNALEGHHRTLLDLYGSHDDRLHGQPGHGRDPTEADLAARAPEQPPVPEQPDAVTVTDAEPRSVGVWEHEETTETVAGEERPAHEWTNERDRMDGGTEMVIAGPTNEDPDVYRVNVGNLDNLESEQIARGTNWNRVLAEAVEWVETHPDGAPPGFFGTALVDDRHVDGAGGGDGLGRFGVEADEGSEAPSEEHRRAQNRGYVRTGSRGFDDDASAREGLGQFAATGGEETLDNFEETDA